MSALFTETVKIYFLQFQYVKLQSNFTFLFLFLKYLIGSYLRFCYFENSPYLQLYFQFLVDMDFGHLINIE